MKSEAKHFDITTLDQLMTIVNANNTINPEYTTLQLNYNILLKNVAEQQLQNKINYQIFL